MWSVAVLPFVVLTTTGGPGGSELHWNQQNVPYVFNDRGSDDLGPEVYPSLEAGFQVWNDVSQVDYSYAGCSSKGKGSVIDGSGDASPDGTSLITWIESGWPYGPGIIGITWTYFFEDGEIDEADMLMNGDDYTWTTDSVGGLTDVQAIAAHESGHYLGLGHTTVAAATMFATVEQGETSKRSLDADDIAGAQYIYGSGSSGGALFDGECEGGGGSGEGCGCSLEGTAAPRPGLLAGILSVIALALFGTLRLRAVRMRVPARAVSVVVAALALFAARDASATVMVDQSLEALVAQSESVVHGDVTSVETKTDGRVIWTEQVIRVRETIAGLEQGETITLFTPGGTLPKGVKTDRGHSGARAEGIPEFRAGEEVVVFVARWRGDAARLTVAALQQGKFLVKRDARGVAAVVRDLSGVLRMEKQGERYEPKTGDDLSGVTLDALTARIRSSSSR